MEKFIIGGLVLSIGFAIFRINQIERLKKKTKENPKTLSESDIGEIFCVLAVDHRNQQVLLMEGIGFMEAPFMNECWYHSENIPEQLLVHRKNFKLLLGKEGMSFQEVYEYVKDEFGTSHVIPKGEPILGPST